MIRLKIFYVLCFTFFITQSYAQTDANKTHKIESKVFNKERRVKVFLPERYQRDTISKFAVVYILDAQSDRIWNLAKGNIGYMVDNYSIMPMIAVGIVSDSRGSEFDPENSDLHKHFKEEVFPLIESHYRVDHFRAVVGHSWGGAFIGNTIFSEHRELFNGYIGISPSFGDSDNVIEKHAKRLLESNTTFGKYLYFSFGTVGRREAEFGNFVKNIDQLIKTNPNASLAWNMHHIQDVDHWQIVGPSFCSGLLYMSRNYFADQSTIEGFAKGNSDLKNQLTEFNASKASTFGYVHRASPAYLNFTANDFRDLENYDTALELYNLALEQDPDNVKVHVNISDIYDKIGDRENAKSSFNHTLKLLHEQRSNLGNNYFKNIKEWIEERLASYN